MLETIKGELEKSSPDDVNLYLITRDNKHGQITYKVFRTEISENISNMLIKISIDKMKSITNNGITCIEYDPMVEVDELYVETIKSDNIDHLKSILNLMKRADLDLFDIKRNRGLWAYSVKIGGSDIALFRKCAESWILNRKKRIAIVEQNGIFDKFTNSILTIDYDIDTICYKNTTYILNKNRFESIFSYMDKFIGEATTNISELNRKSLIDNTGYLLDLCKSDMRKIKRLNYVLQGDALKSLDSEKIKQINDKYTLNLEFNEGGKIKVTSDTIWSVLRVFNDDYLESTTTSNKYEAHSKLKR